MKNYPNVYSETVTLEMAIKGNSLSRFGDGELRICLGGQAPSQVHHPVLERELRAILNSSHSLPCIPTPVGHSPAEWFWRQYMEPKFVKLYGQDRYGSSWVTRSDNAPWIDNAEHWDGVISLWKDKDVVLVTGDEKSLTPHFMHDAKSIRFVHGPRTNAYVEINRLMEEVGTPSEPVLMCLGATATVMAERLTRKGVHALDLGHVGMFMKRWNKRITVDDICTPEYRSMLASIKRAPRQEAMDALAIHGRSIGAEDYFIYDVAMDRLPEQPHDFVICAQMARVERDRLKNVLWHIKTIMKKGGFLVVETAPSKDVLPDGRNAHILIEDTAWWTKQITRAGIRIVYAQTQGTTTWMYLHNVEP